MDNAQENARHATLPVFSTHQAKFREFTTTFEMTEVDRVRW